MPSVVIGCRNFISVANDGRLGDVALTLHSPQPVGIRLEPFTAAAVWKNWLGTLPDGSCGPVALSLSSSSFSNASEMASRGIVATSKARGLVEDNEFGGGQDVGVLIGSSYTATTVKSNRFREVQLAGVWVVGALAPSDGSLQRRGSGVTESSSDHSSDDDAHDGNAGEESQWPAPQPIAGNVFRSNPAFGIVVSAGRCATAAASVQGNIFDGNGIAAIAMLPRPQDDVNQQSHVKVDASPPVDVAVHHNEFSANGVSPTLNFDLGDARRA
jgi:hypothetical protein